jgi:hypothetical protein
LNIGSSEQNWSAADKAWLWKLSCPFLIMYCSDCRYQSARADEDLEAKHGPHDSFDGAMIR